MTDVSGNISADFQTLEGHLADHHGHTDAGDQKYAAEFEAEANQQGDTQTASAVKNFMQTPGPEIKSGVLHGHLSTPQFTDDTKNTFDKAMSSDRSAFDASSSAASMEAGSQSGAPQLTSDQQNAKAKQELSNPNAAIGS